MRRSDSSWSWSAIAFVVFAAVIGTIVSRYVGKLADRFDTNYGYVPNPEGNAEFLRELDEPRFAQAGADCMKNLVREDKFLYRFANDAHLAVYGKPFQAWNQGNAGTCVGFGFAVGSYIGQAVDFAQGKLPEPPKVVAVEPLYAGSRTFGRSPPVTFAGFGDGSYGGAAARWVSGRCKDPEVGGILYREIVGKYDLSRYSIDLARQWGAYGPPRDIAIAASKHRALAVAQVKTWDEAAAALTAGYTIPICSDIGFEATNIRDKDGYLPRGGTWRHCMCCIAIRFAKPDVPGSRDGILVLNSWGTAWCRGGKFPDDQPDGSFWITRADAEAIFRQADSWAIGGVAGFPYRKVEHREWMAPQASVASVNHALAL